MSVSYGISCSQVSNSGRVDWKVLRTCTVCAVTKVYHYLYDYPKDFVWLKSLIGTLWYDHYSQLKIDMTQAFLPTGS